MEMDNLRWILLAIAIVIVVAVYLFSRVRKKDTPYSPLDAANDVPSFSAKNEESNNDWMDGVGPVKIVSSSPYDVEDIQNESNVDEHLELTPEKTFREKIYQQEPYSERETEKDVEPVEETFDETPIIEETSIEELAAQALPVEKPVEEEPVIVEPVVEEPVVEEQRPTAQTDVAIDDVLSVYVLAQQDETIKGEKVLSASYGLQLDYGNMNIFHRHAQTADRKIQFSMANIQQPGYFEIDHINEMETKGVSFFMQANLVENPSDVLDEMLICAHSLSTMLGAVLCDAQRKVLDEESATALREKVKYLESIKAQSV